MLVNSNNYSSPNFGAMKKSQFKGLDLLCVNTFKAPIEKFNQNADLQNWASNLLKEDVFQGNLKGRTPFSTDARKTVFKNWIKYLNQTKNITKAGALVIIKSLFGDLKSKTDAVPPIVNDKIIKKTIEESENKQNFNFKKDYSTNLQKHLLKRGETLEEGWIKISSKNNDSRNFKKNVERLKMFSNGAWCTKSFKSEDYLKDGDFYILNKNSKPVVGIRTSGNTILEIQGEKNNSEIPLNNFDEIISLIDKENLNKDLIREYINAAYEKIFTIKDYSKAFSKEISSNDGLGVLRRLGMGTVENSEGQLVLSKLRRLENGICLSDLGIDENKAFENIVEIDGDAVFENSNATKLPKLKIVNGNLDLRNSNITDLSSLQEVNGNVDLRGSRLCPEDFKNVKVNGEIKIRKQAGIQE